jgi:DNA-binding transcriptional MocR family regulator
MTIWTPILDKSKPLYLAIADAMTSDVENGRLLSGSRLPPQRDLAWRIGVTLGTVTRAYKEAEQRGLLTGEVGRGSYISGTKRPTALPRQNAGSTIDLSHAIPPPVITTEEFDSALGNVMREPRRLELLDYAPPEGFAHHRELGCHWLKRSGINVEASDVVVTAGAHVALLTVLGAIAEPREAVMAEQINYALLGATLRNSYLEALPIEMDAEGLLPEAFERAARSGRSRILYLVPSLQNPTTTTMNRPRREAIVAIARKYDITIIEDDIFRLLDARTQPATFYTLAPERTYHITGLSKVLAPGLRIGFVAVPNRHDHILKSHIRTASSRSIGITAEMARYWIETGIAETILIRIRNELAARRALFLETFRNCGLRCQPAAPYAWLELPEWWTAGRFSTVLAARGIKVTPGNAFQLGATTVSHHVRICFGGGGQSFHLRQAFESIRTLMNERDDGDFTPVA